MIDLKGEIGTLKTALVETGVDVGPVIYLARTFQTDIDTVVKFFIFVLIFVFDPMAVMFVISYNVALEYRDEEDENQAVVKKKKKKWPVYGEKKKEVENKNEVSVSKGLLRKIINQAKSRVTLGGRDESDMNNLEKKI